MMADPICCPCDVPATERDIQNPPGRDFIAYRVGDFASVRRALLAAREGETQLTFWRPGATTDLALQMVEWWAYLADILTFYNERIANESYLRTAELPESVRHLIRLLGYRPRPGLGATGTVAALVNGHTSRLLPAGFAIDSKPGPGQDPQTFELDRDTLVTPIARIAARPPEQLLAPAANTFLIQGANSALAAGALVVLGARNPGVDAIAPVLMRIVSVVVETTPTRAKQTRVVFTVVAGTLPTPSLPAARLRIARPSQSSPVWTLTPGGISGNVVHLAGVARQLQASSLVIVSAPNQTPVLATVTAASDVVFYANPKSSSTPQTPPDPPAIPIPILHTQLTLSVALNAFAGAPAAVTVQFALQDVTPLADQPATSFNGTPPATLTAVAPARFPDANGTSLLLEDANGLGMRGLGSTSNSGVTIALSGLPVPPTTLTPPLAVLFNLLPVSRGKTVAAEVLGSGDATIAAQSFVLKKSPVTYLAKGAGYVSTVQVRVNGQLWQEAASFFDQLADATIFVLSEDDQQRTHVMFGDGVNGARLPTGTNNVIATYRYGSGAASPAAGQLTVMAKPVPNVTGIRNPVAVSGGADPDPPDQIRRYAPRSVLAFNRAVSADDYEVLAAQAPGVVRARSIWSWSATEQRGLVTVYVGDTPAARDAAVAALATTGDPNRHVSVVSATAVPTLLIMLVLVDPRFEPSDVAAAVRTEMLDPDRGVFGANRLRIGDAVFDSQIAEACLRVPGAEALRASLFLTIRPGSSNIVFESFARHTPGEGGFFLTQPAWIWVFTEVATHGG